MGTALDHPQQFSLLDAATGKAVLREAMRLSASALGLVLEPSGAAGLAAIRCHDLPGKRFATILTGSNIHPQMLTKLVDSAL